MGSRSRDKNSLPQYWADWDVPEKPHCIRSRAGTRVWEWQSAGDFTLSETSSGSHTSQASPILDPRS